MKTVYLAVCESMSWGRGHSAWEAIANALAIFGLESAVDLYKLEVPDGGNYDDCFVDKDGAMMAPKGTKLTELGTNKVIISEKFLAFKKEVESCYEN